MGGRGLRWGGGWHLGRGWAFKVSSVRQAGGIREGREGHRCMICSRLRISLRWVTHVEMDNP